MLFQKNLLQFGLTILCLVALSIRDVNGFATVKNHPSLHRAALGNRFYLQEHNAKSDDDDDDDNSWDSPEDYDQFQEDEEDEDDFPLSTPNLGINIGSQLKPLTAEEAKELRDEAKAEIDEAFDNRMEEIEKLKEMVNKDFEKSKEAMRFASDLRAKEQTDLLMSKIDKISNDFLSKNKELREGTKLAASADETMKGKGLDIGSWGTIAGTEVLTSSSSSDSKALLGSVGSAQYGSDVVEAEGFEESVVASPSDNRIMIVCDDQKDKSAKKMLDKFSDLLSDAFDGEIEIKKYSPTSNIPMGGDSAQCVVLVASSLNGQSSALNILNRILKRTAPVAGSKIGVPPSHLVVLSSHGTERTDKFPYSMQNMMGGNKLTKCREVEEAIITTVKSRLIKGLNVPPLDYTVLKVGEIVDDDKASKGGQSFTVMPGDTIDGDIGVNAAANALLQSIAYQPTARNATFSMAGGLTSSDDDKELFWKSLFLKLDGPELLRTENLIPNDDEKEIDRKFETLGQFIIQWSNRYETDARKEGLTTPVSIVRSKRLPSAAEGVLMRTGVRFEFKSTKTGASYQSKSEERAFERQQIQTKPKPGAKKKNVEDVLPMRKQQKEGGIEILVEKTLSNELRVRARRCNMDDKTVIKEISEATILKSLEKAVAIWVKEQ